MSTNTHPITELFTWVSVDDQGNEGIIAVMKQDGWMPLVFSTINLAKARRPAAIQIGEETRKRVRLLKFTDRQMLEEISH